MLPGRRLPDAAAAPGTPAPHPGRGTAAMNILFTDDNFALFRDGFLRTLELTVLSGLLALVLGVLLAAFRVSPVPLLRALGTVWVNVLRNTPLVLLFFAVVFGLPKIGVNLDYFT